MSAAPILRSPAEAAHLSLLGLAGSDPHLRVLVGEGESSEPIRKLVARSPDRSVSGGGNDVGLLDSAIRLATGAEKVFVVASVEQVVGPAYATLRRSVAGPRARIKILAAHDGTGPAGEGLPYAQREDIGLMRGLPGMTVVVPADGPTADAATRTVAAHAGPAYVRLSRRALPTVTDGTFSLARAPVLHDGSDLGVVAVGAMVAPSLDLARELAKVGVSVRVLDLASVKPFDEPALLRAARDTGALLVAEEHTVTTGVGSLVSSVTAENYPVPVRRVGLPDVFSDEVPPEGAFPLSRDRMTDAAWELLRLRGKVE